jgi:hypothetical protein
MTLGHVESDVSCMQIALQPATRHAQMMSATAGSTRQRKDKKAFRRKEEHLEARCASSGKRGL